MKIFVLLALAGLAVAVPIASTGNPLNLVLLPDAKTSIGAMCLDGSPYGFYFSKASDVAFANTWQVFFEGGGWCYNEDDCLGRSTGSLGSSKSWTPTTGNGGLGSDDCNVNPDFCKANRVLLKYCDGNSFSGMREGPVNVQGTDIFFRGHYNLVAALDWLVKNAGLATAENVLLTGCSAGGLSTYLHADFVQQYVKAHVPTLKKYKAAPISGFFLNHETVEGKRVYAQEMAVIFTLSNATHGVNEKCVQSLPAAEQWRCNFATETFKHIESPIFPFNSALDSWQTACVLLSEPVVNVKSRANGNCSAVPNWGDCQNNYNQCSPTQMKSMIGFEHDFVSDLKAAAPFTKAGNGGFYYSCHTHCAAAGGAFNQIAVNGVTMQQAFSKWWAAGLDVPASAHTYMPCYHHDTAPYQCNPTCGGAAAAHPSALGEM